MPRRFPLLILILLAWNYTVAQPAEFGEITPADFGTTALDDESSSVILFDYGKYSFNDFPTMERHIRVKILSKEAFTTWSKFTVDRDYLVSVTKIKAATHTLTDGKVLTEVTEKENILKPEDKESLSILPRNITVGCIIEFSYKIRYEEGLIPNWRIQYHIPVLWSEFLFDSPAELTYVIKGNIKPNIYEPKYRGRFVRWVFKNVHAFKDEPFMPHSTNFLQRIDFYNPGEDWRMLAQNYHRRYFHRHGRFHNPALKQDLREAIGDLTDKKEQLQAICTFMKRTYTWNLLYSKTSYQISDIVGKRKGDTGDLHTILFKMLELAGFEPWHVLASSRQHGIVMKSVVSEAQFNTLLTYVELDGEPFILDVTDPLLPFNAVPLALINTDALAINSTGSKWIRILPSLPMKIHQNARLEMIDDEFKGKIIVTSHGYHANILRKEGKDLDQNWDFALPLVGPNKADSTKTQNLNELKLPVINTHHVSLTHGLMETDSLAYVNPFVYLIDYKNPFGSDEKRKFHTDLLLPGELQYVLNMPVPNGYKVESMPENQTISMPDNSMSCSFRFLSDSRNVVASYQWIIRKTWFEPNEYDALRKFYDSVTAMQNATIVLSK